MATAPSFIEKIWGTIIDPGGDPAAIRQAANACHALAGELRNTAAAIDPAIADLKRQWHGEAADAFQRTSANFTPTLTDYTKQLDEAASSLDNIAAALEEAQLQADNFQKMLWISLGAGLGLTLVTFGTADLVAAEAEAGFMEIVIARLGALLAGESEALSALISAMELTTTRFAYGIGLAIASTVMVKALAGDDVLDPANYSAKDATNILIGGVLTIALGTTSATKLVQVHTAEHPALSVSVAAAAANGVAAGVGQVWLNHNSLFSGDTLEAIGESAGISSASGLVIGGIAAGFARRTGALPIGPETAAEPTQRTHNDGNSLFPSDAFPRPGLSAITRSDLVRGGSGIPAGAVQYYVTIPQEEPTQRVQPPAQAPRIASPPPNSVVARGESLWSIARREYGDGSKYKLIADANHLDDPDHIDPEENLVIPPTPRTES